MSAANDPPLHELAPTTRFSDRADDYVRFRPDYPAAALDAMLAGLGAPDAVPAADVGAGTGISARQLAARGVRVIAIEPNPAMRGVAAPHPGVRWVAAAAERTALASGSLRLVLAAQSFHWFHATEAVAEFGRILAPGGRLALLWNSRDRRDPLTLGFIEAIHAVHGEHPAERRPFDPAVVSVDDAFEPPLRLEFPHAQRLDREGLRGRALSASYVPREEPGLSELLRLLDALFDRHRDRAGHVTLRYRTELWIARRR